MRDNSNTSNRGGAMLPATRLWRKKSGKGVDYLSGRLGNLRVLIMPRREGDEGDHSHVLFVAEATQRDAEGSR